MKAGYMRAILTLSFCLVAGIAGNSFAAEHYIRAGASGGNTGKDWTNAWTQLPSSLVRGDTYYIADGTYGKYTFDDAESGQTYIYIKKATTADHGIGDGWLDSYGDGQAVFTANAQAYTGILRFLTGYWVFDGQVGGGPGSWETGHGFKITFTSTAPIVDGAHLVDVLNGPDYVRFSHAELDGLNEGKPGTLQPRTDGFYSNFVNYVDNSTSQTHIVVSYCYLHHCTRSLLTLFSVRESLLEYNLIERCFGGYYNPASPELYIHRDAVHMMNCGIAANDTIRSNIMRDCDGTAVIEFKGKEQSGLYIYNNVFYATDSEHLTTNGTISNTAGDINSDMHIYNNTFINLNGACGIQWYNGTNSYTQNNIWFNCQQSPRFSGTEHDYNVFFDNTHSEPNGQVITTSPVVNVLAMDFRLQNHTANGRVLPSPYNKDMYNNDRTSTQWDRGALIVNSDISKIGIVALPTAEITKTVETSTLSVAPQIASVTINPSTGYVKTGDSVTITVRAVDNVTGLRPSSATINQRTVTLSEAGSGVYSGVYTVGAGDQQGKNIEATGITLTNADNLTSEVASSTGSTLQVDTVAPTVASVQLSPSSGSVRLGEPIAITVTAGSAESGLKALPALVNGREVQFSDQGSGIFKGTYYVEAPSSVTTFPSNALFSDDFEGGNVSKWNSSTTGIAANPVAKTGSYGVSYDLQSTTRATLTKSLSNMAESYTSFYFQVDPNFVMVPGDDIYISLMADSSNRIPWAAKLRRSGDALQMSVYLGGWTSLVGSWQTIVPGQWYWIKIHHLSASSGRLEWWLDGKQIGVFSGNTSAALSGTLNGIYLNGMDAGTVGKLYYDNFLVTQSDHAEPSTSESGVLVVSPVGISLTDTAGNVGTPSTTVSAQYTIDTSEAVIVRPPSISSVVISPSSGYVKAGDSVAITVTAADNATGLTASAAAINGQSIALTEAGNGVYSGVYNVGANDQQGKNIEATGITLTNADGLTSEPASSHGSTLTVDTVAPSVASIQLSPDSGTVRPGDSIGISVTAANNESGLTVTPAVVNGHQIPLSDQGNGSYSGAYIVEEADAEAAPTDALFTDNFESGDLSGWNTVSSGIATGSVAKFGSYGVMYDIQSTTRTTLTKTLANSAESYTSFYFRVDPNFVMVLNDDIYISLMVDSSNKIPWAAKLRRSGDALQMSVYLGGYTSIVGSWQTIVPGQWYWIKVHHRSATSGTLEWWLDGQQVGTFSGNTSAAQSGSLNGIYLNGMDSGTKGKLYYDNFIVSATDHAESGKLVVAPTGITMTDAAGNTGTSALSTSALYTLELKVIKPPVIASVAISPSSGYVKAGDTVTITATAAENEAGLTASAATINGQAVQLTESGEGVYTGVYTVNAGDPQGVGIEATGITLTNADGLVSEPAASSGSTLTVDTIAPDIASIVLTPSSGTVRLGDAIGITVSAANAESGLNASPAMMNGRAIPLADQKDGTYTGAFIVEESDTATQPAGAVFSDDLESGALSGWDTVSSGIAAGTVAKFGKYGVSYNIQSTTRTTLTKKLADSQESYTSFYFRVDPGFVMALNDDIYISLMSDSANRIPWAAKLRRSGDALQLSVYLGGYTSIVGAWQTIVPGQWYWVKVHHLSAAAGTLEWWLDGQSMGAFSGNTSAAVSGSLNGIYLNGMDAGTIGKLYYDNFLVTSTDHAEPGILVLEPSGITLTDTAGNVGTQDAPAASQYTLDLKVIKPPVIASVSLAPSNGYVKTGDTVTITVTAADNETGLTPSSATINGKSIQLAESGDGVYSGVYTVGASDQQGVNIEATGITLTNADGLVSEPAASSGSTLRVDTIAPTVASVQLSPSSGTVRTGEAITVTVTAGNNESGLSASPAKVNGIEVPLTDRNNGTYTGSYIVEAAASAVPTDAVFSEDCESGTLANWNSASTGITAGPVAKAGNYGVSYTIQSTARTDLAKTLPNSDESYTSFYFRVDPGFVMVPNDDIYISLMTDSANKIPWAAKLRRSGDNLQVSVYFGGYTSIVGSWQTIVTGQWYWIKIHHFRAGEGVLEWWLDGQHIGAFNGNTSAARSGSLHGIYLNGMDAGTTGTLYYDNFLVTPTNHEEAALLTVAASDIVLTDPAGNSSQAAVSSEASFTVSAPMVAAKMAIPSARIAARIMNDLKVEHVSETIAILSWTAPSASHLSNYSIEISKYPPEGGVMVSSISVDPGISPSSAGTQEKVKLTSLDMGSPYYVMVKAMDGSDVAGASNIVNLTTLVGFVDDDLDINDPYIARDADSLFVADNDNAMTFVWSSLNYLGVNSYEVAVVTGNDQQTVRTDVTATVNYVYMPTNEGSYSITVTPVMSDGGKLPALHSRTIYCSPAVTQLEPPGKPELVTNK